MVISSDRICYLPKSTIFTLHNLAQNILGYSIVNHNNKSYKYLELRSYLPLFAKQMNHLAELKRRVEQIPELSLDHHKLFENTHLPTAWCLTQ